MDVVRGRRAFYNGRNFDRDENATRRCFMFLGPPAALQTTGIALAALWPSTVLRKAEV